MKTGLMCCVSCLLLLAGCATKPKATGKKYYFFPPPPDAPRLQFLTAFGSEKDLRGSSGSFLSFVTGEKPAENPIAKPYGVAFSQNEILVCDTAYGVVLSLDLETRRMRSISPRGEGTLKLPLNLAVDRDGTMYIVDSGREQVIILDAEGHFVAALGAKGAMKPRDVAVTADRLYLADVEGHCVHVYNKADRKPLFDVPGPEDAASVPHRLFQPTNIAVDSQGRIYASDTGAYRIQVYDAQGKFLRTLGKYGDNVGEFTRVKGVAVDRENRCYAVDAAAQVVQVFDDQGRLLMWFGQPETTGVGLELPAKVIVDYDHVGLFQKYAAPGFKLDHLVVVVNQLGPRKVSIFGFGQKR
jgi:hypothetical protein